MKNLIPLSAVLLAAAVCADPADPQISNVRLEQNSVSRRVTVRYDLDEAAVVTMDVLTNGVSIGGANIQAVHPGRRRRLLQEGRRRKQPRSDVGSAPLVA